MVETDDLRVTSSVVFNEIRKISPVYIPKYVDRYKFPYRLDYITAFSGNPHFGLLKPTLFRDSR